MAKHSLVFFFFEFLLLLLLPFRLFFHSARRDIRAHFLLSQVTLFAFGLHFGSVFFFFFFFTGGTFYCPSCAFGSSSFFFFSVFFLFFFHLFLYNVDGRKSIC